MAEQYFQSGFGPEALGAREFALINGEGGSPYGFPADINTNLPSADALKVTVAAGNLNLSVSAGAVTGYGHRYLLDAAKSLTLAPLAAPNFRWDMVAIRRDWAARTATCVAVTGPTGPNLVGDPASRFRRPGSLKDDQPIAYVLVEGGKTTVQRIVKAPQFAPTYSADALSTVPTDIPGTQALIANETLVWSGSAWVSQMPNRMFSGTVTHTYRGGTQPAPTYVQFPQWFKVLPSVTLCCNDPDIDLWYSVKGTQSFYINSRSRTGPRAVLNLDISWTAAGPRLTTV